MVVGALDEEQAILVVQDDPARADEQDRVDVPDACPYPPQI